MRPLAKDEAFPARLKEKAERDKKDSKQPELLAVFSVSNRIVRAGASPHASK